MNNPKRSQSGKKQLWLIPVVLLIILSLSVGGYYASGLLGWRENNETEKIDNTSETTIPTTTEDLELIMMRETLNQETFFEGIWVDGIDLSGKSYTEAADIFQKRDAEYGLNTVAVLTHNDLQWTLLGKDCGIMSNWREILEQAWQTGRLESDDSDEATIREKYKWLQSIQKNPLAFQTTQSWDEFLIRKNLVSIAKIIDREPIGATATGFDTGSRTFILNEGVTGFTMNIDQCQERILAQLQTGDFDLSFPVDGSITTTGKTVAQLQASLSLVSEARTYARTVNPPRDENIRLVCQKINGMVMQPGDVFSFNRYIGERTAAAGFKAAGGIVNGVLEPDIYGGGICQPSSTLYLAVAQADLEVVERHPHSWPSTYVPIGLDATVSWGGPDFKFRNDTDDPIAIVAWYDKPAVVVQVYGRSLGAGVSISLTSTHDGYIPVEEPKGTYNPDLKPGQKLVTREEHIGQLATSYKVWNQNGSVIKREVLAKSRYRPIQGLFEYGPPVPTQAPPVEDNDETTTSTASGSTDAEPTETTTEETSATTGETSGTTESTDEGDASSEG